MRDIIIGLDAGTSLIKAVAFDLDGKQLGAAGARNQYQSSLTGAALQDMPLTWQLAVQLICELSEKITDLSKRVRALGVTGQGDGTWLINEKGAPVAPAMLWLDSRAAQEAQDIATSDGYEAIYAATATGVNPCQMRSQLRWMEKESPDLLNAATAALHCKEWLYFQLTGEVVADVSEAVLNFGDIRTRDYSDDVIKALELDGLRHLLPPIVDGSKTAHPLGASAAAQTGLPVGLPVCLGFMDIVTSGVAVGLCDPVARPGLSILGTTGVHMRHAATADDVIFNPGRTGYTVALADGAFGQVQTNMAAAMNIDWIAGIAKQILASTGVSRSETEILAGFDELVAGARCGAAIYHPYIASTGERGPFLETNARASFTGLDQSVGWGELVRSVYEGLAMAARDCYAVMGSTPQEIRVAGGAARSTQLVRILASVLNRPVRAVAQAEAGAAGSAMIAAVQCGVFETLEQANDVWVTPVLGDAVLPESEQFYDALFPAFQSGREALLPIWHNQANIKET